MTPVHDRYECIALAVRAGTPQKYWGMVNPWSLPFVAAGAICVLPQSALAADPVPESPQDTSPSPDAQTRWPRKFQFVAKWDWALAPGRGGGGSLGLGWQTWEFGVMGLATPLNPVFRDNFLVTPADAKVPLNWGAEVYLHKFFRPDRRWFFVGALISYDQFRIHTGDEKTTLNALYVAPTAGVKIKFLRWFFVEPSLGLAIRVWDDGRRQPVGIDAQAAAPLFFIPLGFEI